MSSRARRADAPTALTGLVMLAALASAGPLAAQLGPIGLSTVGAQLFVKDDPTSASDVDGFGSALAAGDFNGDGIEDLATGVPYDYSGGYGSGAVHVRYGHRPSGLDGGAPLVLRQSPETAAHDEKFGAALAAGDFDGDSFDDLAVGIPLNVPGSGQHEGGVRVYYGSSSGLSNGDYEFIDSAVLSVNECAGSEFGAALVAADFDGNVYADLAIGVPNSCISSRVAGSVHVLHGASGGLLAALATYQISQDEFGVYDEAESGDRFGEALAAADFDGDGVEDLAIGVPGENEESGAVQIFMGNDPFGLIFANSVFWLPGALGEDPEIGAWLGRSLAAGDFDGDGFADLAIGSPAKNLSNPLANAGAIYVGYGAPDPYWFDLSRADSRVTLGGITGIADAAGNLFGWSLLAADFDRDGRHDLAIGVPGYDGYGDDEGGVTILMGAACSIGASTRHHVLGLGSEGVPGDPARTDLWAGVALGAGDFDGSGRVDLAIGAAGQPSVPIEDTVEVVLYGDRGLLRDGFERTTDYWSRFSPEAGCP